MTSENGLALARDLILSPTGLANQDIDRPGDGGVAERPAG